MPEFLKRIILLVLVLFSAFLSGYYLSKLFLEFGVNNLIYFAIAEVFWLAFLFISYLVSGNWSWKVLLSSLSILVILIQFYNYLHWYSWILALVVLVTFLWSAYDLQKVYDNSLKINFVSFFKVFSSKVFTGLIIFICLFIYQLYLSSMINDFPISQDLFNKMIDPALKLARPIIEKQLKVPEIKLPGNLQLPSFLEVSSIPSIEQAIQKATETFYLTIKEKYLSLDKKVKIGIVSAILMLCFSVIRIVFIVFGFVAVPFAFLIYQILLGTKFIYLELESRDKQVIKM